MAKFVWGVDPLAASRLGRPEGESPLTLSELACLGIAPHKRERVAAELARLGSGMDEATLRQLAEQLADQLL